MLKKFRIWMADMFITLAMMADFDSVLFFVIESAENINAQIAKNAATPPPTKRGRPKGRKDSVGGKASA